MRAVILVPLLALAAAAAVSLRPRAADAQAPPQAPPPAAVEVAPAVETAIAPLQWVPGSVLSREDARIATELAGRIVAIAEVGAVLRRGESIAKLDAEQYRLALARQDAEVERIETQLRYARRQAERLEGLVERSTIASRELDQARADRDVLELSLREARAGLAEQRRLLAAAKVTAPFDGVVAERLASRGEFVAAGLALVRLVDVRQTEVQSRAPVALAASLAAGDAVRLRIDGSEHEGRIRTVVPVGDASSRQLEVRVSSDAKLPVGSALDVGLPLGAPKRSVAVPRDALVLRDGGTWVFRIGADRKAARIGVATGDGDADTIAVEGGVEPGDLLVVRGAERLADGQSVVIRGEG
jgi:RND family efflux transporter MFP subunit